MATDETAYPGAVFRMQHCYVHDANGGNNVKSRAERNEIYYNWIEGAYYHELELIGPDGQAESLKREDSDVVMFIDPDIKVFAPMPTWGRRCTNSWPATWRCRTSRSATRRWPR